MRNIKKKYSTRTVECLVYDKVLKQERTISCTLVNTDKAPELPPDCFLIGEVKVISEKEVTYSMTPDTFIKHATPEKDKNAETAE